MPFYRVTSQVGVDVQHTRGAWLWKLEALAREGRGASFGAAVACFERTFYQIGGSSADLGVLAEVLWDGRDPTTTTGRSSRWSKRRGASEAGSSSSWTSASSPAPIRRPMGALEEPRAPG
ncbi:MAG TPA: hypothetical protein VGG06_28855 [Thermoanaerobaculia bacterium]